MALTDKEYFSESKRHKLRDNKTIMLSKVAQTHNNEPKAKKSEKSFFERIFGFRGGRKEPIHEHADLHPDSEIKPEHVQVGSFASSANPSSNSEIKQEHVQEPDILREIDTGKRSGKIEPEFALWLADGRKIKSTDELLTALKTLSARNFKKHRENHDVPDWIKYVVGDSKLALKIEKATTKKDAISILKADQKKRKNSRDRKATAKPFESASGRKDGAIESQLQLPEAINSKKRKLKKKSKRDELERKLAEEEYLIDLEEKNLSKKRAELDNRRYALIKMRGELEKEKFGEFLEDPNSSINDFNMETSGISLPELDPSEDYSKEKMKKLVEEARRRLVRGDKYAADKIKRELETCIELSGLDEKEVREFKYAILELEADIKLTGLA